ncbi:fungal-specific transcription factor domain-containing protein [Emericellopsis atlantica]|uniref:Fungal-specific transcription factor domain-containing protein n=1 Tax=Emericellopsis atlantica TaxID=2614577 RepID=A0A9P7ZI69_9HYPO|nr:fungal-specific transcription factor domain-containing protein [Emericellopsis atlantica]KAG9252519.1 fungal-specific transcription factor domain-containing protein [Emericellopsis atlantica]
MQTTEDMTRPRRRAALQVSQIFSACSFCKARKIRCDGVSPACGGCAKFGRQASCSLRSNRGRDYPTYLQSRIESLQRTLEHHRAASRGHAGPDPDSRGHGGQPTAHSSASQSAIDSLIADIGVLPIMASTYSSTHDGITLSTVALSTASMGYPSFSIASHLSQVPNLEDPASFLPERSLAVKLIQHYLAHVYPRLPFFSIQGLWAQFEQVYALPHFEAGAHNPTPPIDPEAVLSPSIGSCNTSSHSYGYSFFTVLHVLAISVSSLSRSADSTSSNQARKLFQAALSFREFAILPNSIVGVQSLLFLIQFATLNPSLLDVWYLIGVGMRICVDLGLHQDPRDVDKLSESLLETRRRLWWSMYSFDRSMSIGCSRAQEISDAVINVALPTFRIETTANEAEIHGYLQRYRILQIQSEIYDYLKAAPSSDSPDPATIVARLGQKLSAWHDTNSAALNQTLLRSEWLMGRILLLRPCPLLPHRSVAEVGELWKAATAFTTLYRDLVQTNSIFYVQIAAEKAYWIGLIVLHCYWRLQASEEARRMQVRPLDLWTTIKDILYILRALSDRWNRGKWLYEAFDDLSGRFMHLVEEDANGTSFGHRMPAELQNLSDYTSLTSIWTDSRASWDDTRGEGLHSEELERLVSDMT